MFVKLIENCWVSDSLGELMSLFDEEFIVFVEVPWLGCNRKALGEDVVVVAHGADVTGISCRGKHWGKAGGVSFEVALIGTLPNGAVVFA